MTGASSLTQGPVVIALDQGTTSTRAIVVNHAGQIVASASQAHSQYFPGPGLVEHDPQEIWQASKQVLAEAIATSGVKHQNIRALGITNQRETTVAWLRHDGSPAGRALVWQDTRSQPIADELARDGGPGRFTGHTGLPLASYFSATKIAWLLRHRPELLAAAHAGDLQVGTIDSWLIYRLTGGAVGGSHLTDVTNASRTMLMDIESLTWSEQMCRVFDVPAGLLPQIRPSLSAFGVVAAAAGIPELVGVPITAVLGDQHASLFGHCGFAPGETKNTYGTGCFILTNTGTTPLVSRSGLVTTVAYQREGEPARYALEGSVAVAGSLIGWLENNLGLISSPEEAEALAHSVEDTADVYLVPAFSGLYAPHWRPDARGVLVGLTRYTNRAHVARAALEASAFQVADVADALRGDLEAAGLFEEASTLRVDGGMTSNALLMQFQADILQRSVSVSAEKETTALGAAFAAGLSAGFWDSQAEIMSLREPGVRFTPRRELPWAEARRARWARAVSKSFDWVDPAD